MKFIACFWLLVVSLTTAAIPGEPAHLIEKFAGAWRVDEVKANNETLPLPRDTFIIFEGIHLIEIRNEDDDFPNAAPFLQIRKVKSVIESNEKSYVLLSGNSISHRMTIQEIDKANDQAVLTLDPLTASGRIKMQFRLSQAERKDWVELAKDLHRESDLKWTQEDESAFEKAIGSENR